MPPTPVGIFFVAAGAQVRRARRDGWVYNADMVASMILALVLHGHLALQKAAVGGEVWEETVMAQRVPGFHPLLRFNTQSTMIRFSPVSNYMLLTPDLVQQGQFQVDGAVYHFRAVSAIELEKADVAKLVADMSRQAGHNFAARYAKSTYDFEGAYNRSNGTLSITYPVKGIPESFALHLTTEGDDLLPMRVSAEEAGMIGVWHTPEPFPDKLDARTRAKIELDGLQRFAKEAEASNEAQFGILDLRRDETFRSHASEGTWTRNGSTLTLMLAGRPMVLTISRDGTELLAGGRPAYVRN